MHIYGEAKERDLKQLPFSVPKFWHYRDGQTVFSSIAADWGNGYILTGLGDPLQVLGENVTANYFDLLGIRPILGRNFLPKEEMHDDVALITENFWRKRLSSDPGVLGRSIALNGVATTIVSVLPSLPISWFGRDTEVFTVKPFKNSNATKERMMLGYSFMRCIGRLKPGVTMQQAQSTMPAFAQSYRTQHTKTADCTWTSVLVSAPEDVTGDLRPAFVTLLIAVGAVLLIACRKSQICCSFGLAVAAARSHCAWLWGLTGVMSLDCSFSKVTTVNVITGIIRWCLALSIVAIAPKMAGDNVPLENSVSLHWPVLVSHWRFHC